MHYYKRNIGDYHKKAGRLSILQHGAYTLLIDSCYDREIFPTMEDAIDWVWASSDSEVDAVKFVLKKFFIEDDGFYIQNRIQEDLAKYHANSLTNKRIAIERENKKKQTKAEVNSTKREQTVNDKVDLSNEATPNHKPLTKNKEPYIDNRLFMFDEFWDLYDKKKGRPKCEGLWKKLTGDEVGLIFNSLSNYVLSTPEKQFRSNPETWLRNKGWNDEVIINGTKNQGTNAGANKKESSHERIKRENDIKYRGQDKCGLDLGATNGHLGGDLGKGKGIRTIDHVDHSDFVDY